MSDLIDRSDFGVARVRTGRSFGFLVGLVLLGGALITGGPAFAQPAMERAFVGLNAGEVLEFDVRSSRFGEVGSGRMSVEGPVRIRGRDTLLLSMEIAGRVTFFRFSDRTRSWYDPTRGASLRFEKEERHPLARREEAVDLLPDEGRWENAQGHGGSLAHTAPLDELSILYHLRGLGLQGGSELALNRHFDDERNPVRVKVLRRETIEVPAGRFRAVLVEMEVRDPRRYDEGANVIRIHFSDDDLRLPLRIESSAPMVGTLVMSLRSWQNDGT